jgi:cysteine desulfurase/selenocysteine lyase
MTQTRAKAVNAAQPAETSGGGFDVEATRRDFPILAQRVNGKPLVYLDNAATSQKPMAVIEAIERYYREYNSNVHRGLHALSEKATQAYERARSTVRRFLGAGEDREIVFVRGTTEAINLVATSFVKPRLQAGDEMLITHMEHHSNIVPWQMLREQTGAVLKVVPIDDRGQLELDALKSMLSAKTKILALGHISNALGTINPVKQIVAWAHEKGVPVLIDGAQAAPHMAIDVRDIGADFYAISGHKMFGPTGIGALFARVELLEKMQPYQGGGEMIRSVTFERTTFNDIPMRFEAGTPNIAGAIGLGAAVDYLNGIGMSHIAAYEHELLEYATSAIAAVPGVRLVGTAHEKAAVISFVLGDIHAHDLGTILDHDGIAIRSGHHCAQPVMDRFGVPATARVSLAVYNTREEIDAVVTALHKAIEVFA